MEAAIVIGLFLFLSLVLVILCVRMRNKPSMFTPVTEKKVDVPEPMTAQAEESPKFPKVYIPKKQGDDKLPPDTDFEDAMMHLNTADRVGNVFWNSFNRDHDDD